MTNLLQLKAELKQLEKEEKERKETIKLKAKIH